MFDLTNVFALAQKELRDARRNRWYWLYVGIFSLLSLLLAWLGLSGMGSYGLAGFGRTSASIINLVILVIPLMGITLGALSLSSERESGTLLFLLSQPITSLELIFGKFIGLSLALGSALALGFGVSGVLIIWQGGLAQAGSYLFLIGFSFLLALVALSIGFLISELANKAVAAVSLGLFIWLVLVFIGDLGVLGTAIVLELDLRELFALTLINPLQIFKLAAVLNIRDSLEALGPAGLYAFRTFGTSLMPMLVSLLIVWIIVPLTISCILFRRRGAL
jgi:Cu-processing system permease protein